MQHERDDLYGRSISMLGLLALLVGFGMLLSYVKFNDRMDQWSSTQRQTYFAVGAVSGLWGLRQLLVGYSSRGGGRPLVRGSRHRRHFPRPGLVYLLIMIVMFVGAAIGHSNMLMLVFGLMAGPFILNGWATFSMLKRIRVTRRMPAHAMAGEPFSVDVTVENHKRLLSSWLMTVRDRIANEHERLNAQILFARVPRRGQHTGHYQLRLMQRGLYRFGPILLATRFPFGLVERGLLFDVADEILVYPRVGRLSSSWKRQNLTGSELSQRQQQRRGAFDDEFHRIREFRRGDNPRAIHWRTSARHNQLMVCEYRPSRDRDLLLLVDLWQPTDPRDVDVDHVELAVSLAATICVEHLRENRDSQVSLLVAGRRYESWDSLGGPGSIDPLLKALATVEGDARSQSERLLEAAQARRSTSLRTIMVTTRSRIDGSLDDVFNGKNGNHDGISTAGIQVVEARERTLAEFFELQ